MTADLAAQPSAALDHVRFFADRLAHVSWFAAVGEPLSEAERDDAAGYLAGLDYKRVAVMAVAGWAPAATLTRDVRADEWWQREEAARRALLDRVAGALGEARAVTALTRVTDKASEIVLGAAAIATTRALVADPYLARVAAGAATQAAYQGALALLAEAGDDHPFAAKFRLFTAGRWPLGVIDGSFYLF